MRSIALLPLVARCLRDNRCNMAHVCFYVCCINCVEVCGNVCCVATVVEDSRFWSLGVLTYVVCLCKGCDGCYMFVSCVHPVAVIHDAFCMT